MGNVYLYICLSVCQIFIIFSWKIFFFILRQSNCWDFFFLLVLVLKSHQNIFSHVSKAPLSYLGKLNSTFRKNEKKIHIYDYKKKKTKKTRNDVRLKRIFLSMLLLLFLLVVYFMGKFNQKQRMEGKWKKKSVYI